MKTRLIVIAILLLILAVLLSRNDTRISDIIFGIINPIKQNYQNFTQNIEDKSQSYLRAFACSCKRYRHSPGRNRYLTANGL